MEFPYSQINACVVKRVTRQKIMGKKVANSLLRKGAMTKRDCSRYNSLKYFPFFLRTFISLSLSFRDFSWASARMVYCTCKLITQVHANINREGNIRASEQREKQQRE